MAGYCSHAALQERPALGHSASPTLSALRVAPLASAAAQAMHAQRQATHALAASVSRPVLGQALMGPLRERFRPAATISSGWTLCHPSLRLLFSWIVYNPWGLYVCFSGGQGRPRCYMLGTASTLGRGAGCMESRMGTRPISRSIPAYRGSSHAAGAVTTQRWSAGGVE